jgi:YidC/Oxa1 family membrane protein insertase
MAEFKNPQSEPGMEQRFLLVFLLMAVVIFGSQLFMRKYMPQQPPSSARPAQTVQPAQAQSTQGSSPSAVNSATSPISVTQPGSAKVGQTESETVIENDLYRITFTNRGAQAKSWILKKYSDDDGRPLDLVNAAASAKYGYPLSLWTYDEGLRNRLASALYATSETGNVNAPTDLTFEYSEAGLVVRKAFHFDHSYVVRAETSVFLNDAPQYAFPSWPAGFGDQTNLPAYATGQFEYQINNDTEHISAKKISSGNTLHGTFNWVGASSSYFGAIFIPDKIDNVNVVTLRNAIDVAPDPSKPTETKPGDVVGVAVGHPGEFSARLFVGPKSLEVLESVPVPSIIGDKKNLGEVLNFGWFGVIARPLFAWRFIGLRWLFDNVVHNWGWAIVIQTFIITIALLPLRIYQMKSALKMQRVQPQMKAIQEKYKKYSMRDPRKQDMQKEIGELYKREKVNPVGGCLPLIFQMPFLYAYYRMLSIAIDLRQAHWLWIHDLSARDPYLLLPAIMVISMFAMQKMTPQAGVDPAQQKMMNIMMPAMMGFIFYNLAAGLNLYYAESNLIMILQQSIMNRTKLGREMQEIAAKRARKKDR